MTKKKMDNNKSERSDCINKFTKNDLEAPGIDPGTSRMLSERSTI